MQSQLWPVFYAPRMIREAYPDGYVTQPAPSSRLPVTFAVVPIDPVAFEEEEPEHPESAIGYGSLLSLGSSIRKKKPLIEIDPVEAENEARRVQFVAAQQLVDPDEADGIDFRECLVELVEPDPAADDFPAPEVPDEADEIAIDTPAESEEFGEEPASNSAPLDADPAEAEPVCEAQAEMADDPAEASDPELLLAVEGLARIYQARSIERIEPAIPPQPEDCEPAATQPEPRSHGHSLRALVPTQAPGRTLGDRAFAFLRWLGDWLTRPR